MIDKRILVISNDCFSNTQNNGKTIYSHMQFFAKKNIAQLYFNPSIPEFEGYRYFRITDMDVLKGKINKSKRGRSIVPESGKKEIIRRPGEDSIIPKNDYTKIIREWIWRGSWRSRHLTEWLDEFNPDIVFFVAGDCLFAHSIAIEIQKKYSARFCVYITDDYVLPRKDDSFVIRIRRKKIMKTMRITVGEANMLFTISNRMRETYKTYLGKDSEILMNLTESLYDEKILEEKKDNDLVLTYVGGLYWGREDTLYKLATVIKEYNKETVGVEVRLDYCSNEKPSDIILGKMDGTGVARYCGSLNRDQLKQKLNMSDVLVFVESFDETQIAKTRLSFSTKIPEYLSLRKPILAIGPRGIGSMDYLNDVAFCVTDTCEMQNRVFDLLNSSDIQEELGKSAYKKYSEEFDRNMMIESFMNSLLGADNET